MGVPFAKVKSAAREALEPGHPAREALLLQPDTISEAEFDALLPTWVRLLRLVRFTEQ